MTPQQFAIAEAARTLERLLAEVVPPSTMHWVVEDARKALPRLYAGADGIRTWDAR